MVYPYRPFMMSAAFAIAAFTLWLNPAFGDDVTLPDLPIVNRHITVVDAVKIALANNLMLRQSQTDYHAATAAEHSAHAQTRPSISATTYGLLGDSNNLVTSSPGVMPQNIMPVMPHGFADQNLTVMVPLFTGGKLAGQVEAAGDNAQSAKLTFDQVSLTVRETAIQAYTKVSLQHALVGVAQARLDAETEQVRVTEERTKTGRSAPVDLLREQAEEADAHQGVIGAQNSEAAAMVDLKVALGVSQASELDLDDQLGSLSLSNGLPSSLRDALQIAEANRPDLAAALKVVDAARANVKTARSAYSPQVYGVGMADASSTSENNRVGYTVGLSASIPLYDAGQRRADVDGARARLDRAVADAQASKQSIDQQVITAWLSVQTARQEVDAANTGVVAAQQAYDLETMRYNAGKAVVVERLDAQEALTRAKGGLASAKADLIDAQAVLAAVIGSNE